MEQLQIVTLFIFLFSTLGYFLALLYVAKKFEKYTPEKYSVSWLGTRYSNKYKVYNIATVAYGLLNVFFAFILSGHFQASMLKDILVYSQAALGVSMILVVIFNEDIRRELHYLFGTVLFLCSLCIGIVVVALSLIGELPRSMMYIDIVLISITLIFSYLWLRSHISKNHHKATWKLEWAWVLIFTFHSLFFATVLLFSYN